jgi:DNA-binding LacI/PurR family transcriptional regulator
VRPSSKRKSTRTKLDIRTVAARADVSIATVSRTINSIPTVSPELAERVWKAIRELNYFPNTQARSLVSGRSRIFGLIVPEITNPFFPELVQGFEDIAVEHGFEMLVSSTNNNPERMNVCIRRMLERKVEGVAVMTFGMEEPLLEQLSERNVPLVLTEFLLESPHVSTLLLDYETGYRLGIEHLVKLGHRNIAFISGPLILHSARSRRLAFSEALKEFKLPLRESWMIEGDHTLEAGVMGFQALAAKGEIPTAIMCSNDMTAIGVLKAAYHAHVRVPDDLSVIGLDDIHFAEYTLPSLTTIRLSGVEIARAAFRALHAQVQAEAGKEAVRKYPVSTSLVVRESTTSPRKSSSFRLPG